MLLVLFGDTWLLVAMHTYVQNMEEIIYINMSVVD